MLELTYHTDQQRRFRISSHLLRVLELPPETLIHSFGGLLRTTHHGLYIDLKAAVQKLVYLPVIIVIIPEHAKKHKVSKGMKPSEHNSNTNVISRNRKKTLPRLSGYPATDLMPNMQWM